MSAVTYSSIFEVEGLTLRVNVVMPHAVGLGQSLHIYGLQEVYFDSGKLLRRFAVMDIHCVFCFEEAIDEFFSLKADCLGSYF